MATYHSSHTGPEVDAAVTKLSGASSNIQTQLDAKAPASGIDAAAIGDGSVSNAEFERLDATSSIQTQLNAKAPSSGIAATAIANGSVSDAEFQRLDGVTSAIQTQLDAKAPSSGINATAISDGSVSNTEFGYLDGVTSAIQTQLNAKAPSTAIAATAIASGTVDNTEFGYLDGVTSAIQTQFGNIATRYDNREQRTGASQARRPRPGIYCDGNASAKGTTGSPVTFGTGNFTVAFSLLMADYTPASAVTIFQTDQDATNNLTILLSTAGAFVVRINDGSNHDFTLTPDVALVDGLPYDVCISVTRSGNAVLYLNGITDRDYNSTGVSVSVSSQSSTNISAGPETGAAFGLNFTGILYSLRLYTRALSAADAAALAVSGVVDHADVVSGCILDLDFDFANPAQSGTVRDRVSSTVYSLTTANTTQVLPIKQLNVVSTFSIGGLSQLKGMISASASLNFASISALASADLTITTTGAVVGDTVALGLPSAPTAGIIYMAFVSATNTVTVRATNITALAVDPAAQTFRVSVFQF